MLCLWPFFELNFLKSQSLKNYTVSFSWRRSYLLLHGKWFNSNPQVCAFLLSSLFSQCGQMHRHRLYRNGRRPGIGIPLLTYSCVFHEGNLEPCWCFYFVHRRCTKKNYKILKGISGSLLQAPSYISRTTSTHCFVPDLFLSNSWIHRLHVHNLCLYYAMLENK